MSGLPEPITCFGCGTANDPGSENCFRCGRGLFVLTEGALLASRYEIQRPLGKGGMGMVYRARDRELDETVAVKVLRPEVGLSPEMTARFRSEIKLARRVSHRNVCRIHEYGRDGYLTYIVMEYVDGRDLRQTVRERGAMPAVDAYLIAVQLAEGLQAIHDVGIVHRDLKTANVMLDRQGQVKLMDFGIAKSLGVESAASATLTGQIVGTPEYMSPEQARAEKVDLRTDLYSFGVILFELFSGDVPFRGETPVATLMKHLQELPPLGGAQSHRMPAALIPILSRALAKPREERFGSARELLEALRKAQEQPAASAAATWIMERPLQPEAGRAAPAVATAPLPTPSPVTPRPATVQPVTVQPATARPPTVRPPQVPTPRPVPAAPPTPVPAPRRAETRPHPRWIAGAALAVAALGGTALVWLLTHQNEAPASMPSATPAAVGVENDARPATTSPPTFATAPPESTLVTAPSPTTVLVPAREPTLPARAAPSPRPTRSTAATVQGSPAVDRSLEPVVVVPQPTAIPAGRLQLRVVPWAEVSVDGVSAGTTPLKPLSLPPGTHTIRLTHPAFQPLTRRVEVHAGQTTVLDIDLKFEAFPKQD